MEKESNGELRCADTDSVSLTAAHTQGDLRWIWRGIAHITCFQISALLS